SFHAQAFTMAFHMRGESQENLAAIANSYIDNPATAVALDQVTTGTAAGAGTGIVGGGIEGVLTFATGVPPGTIPPIGAGLAIGTQFVMSILANNDIVLPTGAIDSNKSNREVGSHEFGHFIFMNF